MQVPNIQAQKQTIIGTKVLPGGLAAGSRLALHRALFKAIQKHINGEIISFFEDTNAHAEKIIANSPLKSPPTSDTSSRTSSLLRTPPNRESAFSDASSVFSSAEWSEPIILDDLRA